MVIRTLLIVVLFVVACGRPLGVPERVDDPKAAGSIAPASEQGTPCGGAAVLACESRLHFCEFPIDCGGREAEGFCTPRPDDCTGANSKQPECGCDGVTYDNECLRQSAGVSLLHAGTCPRD